MAGLVRNAVVVLPRAYQVHGQVMQALRVMNGAWLVLAKLLVEVRSERLYQDLGYDSFDEYLATPELGLDGRTVRRWLAAYEATVHLVNGAVIDEERLLAIGSTKLEAVRPLLDAGADPEEVLSRAEALSVRDLKLSMRELRGEVIDELREELAEALFRFGSRVRRGDALGPLLAELEDWASRRKEQVS